MCDGGVIVIHRSKINAFNYIMKTRGEIIAREN